MIRRIHDDSNGTHGMLRVHAELLEGGCQVGRKRVARLVRESGLVGVSRRRGTRTTRVDRNHRAAADRVEREFRAEAPDKLWVADVTYVPTWNGFVYLAIVLDVFGRKVVGWAMANHLRTELVLEALNMAIAQRCPQGVIHHSDKGAQYTSLAFGKRCTASGPVSLRASCVGWSTSRALMDVPAPSAMTQSMHAEPMRVAISLRCVVSMAQPSHSTSAHMCSRWASSANVRWRERGSWMRRRRVVPSRANCVCQSSWSVLVIGAIVSMSMCSW